jgi:hypothetical protein
VTNAKAAMEVSGRTRDEIVALLFSAAMSGNADAFAHQNGIEPATLRTWKLQYISDYVRYLEAVLFRIKDQIDY